MDFQTVLAELILKSGCSRPEIAKGTGLSESSIDSYMRSSVHSPSFSAVIKLADFFAVPLDVLAGRCTEAEYESVMKDYGRHFMALRRASFEKYLAVGCKCGAVARPASAPILPWPYNLLSKFDYGDESGGGANFVVAPEHEAAIVEAINSLEPRLSRVLLEYYRDGKTAQMIADEIGVTRERIRQNLRRGLEQLRSPSRRTRVLYGPEAAEKESHIRKMKAKLLATEEEIDKKLAEAEEWLAQARLEAEFAQHFTVRTPEGELRRICASPISAMNLSTRPHRALLRHGCETVGDVLELARKRELYRIHNLGTKSCAEIVEELHALTGEYCRQR